MSESGGPSSEEAEAAGAGRQALAYRLLGAACALVGVLLVVGGLIALRGKDPDSGPPAAAPTSTSASPSPSRTPLSTIPAPTTATTATTPAPATTSSKPAPPTTTRPTPAPTTTPPTGIARSPLTVLNNTTTSGLADRAAGEFRAGGWTVSKVGNYTGSIPNTTVYYTPGHSTEQQSATALAKQFGIARVLPRYEGLPASATGVVVVLAPDWTGGR